jgi:uncharacterized repeat protein (TIGR01451 family)
MKKFNIIKGLTILMMSGLFTLANAGGTQSGTTVTNMATLSFGDAEDSTTDIDSNTDQFVVDNKIDITVSTLDVSAIQTRPGATGVVLKYKVTNNGNNVQDFDLSALRSSNTAFSGANEVTDTIDAQSVEIFVDSDGNNAGEYGSEDTISYIDELGIGAEKIVFIVIEVKTENIVNGDVAVYDLQAQVAVGESEGTKGSLIETDDRDNADNALTVQIVFADGAGSVTGDGEKDGKHSSADAFKIVIADMSITKVSIVVEDPINGTTNPKRIPGATVRYCFTVTNSGSASAAVTKITDDLDETTFNVSTLDNNAIKIYDGDAPFECENAGSLTTNANTGSVNNGTGVIVIDLDGVAANSEKSAYLDLIIQ